MVRHPYVRRDQPWSQGCEDKGCALLRLMQRPIPWLWIVALAVLLVAPGFTARLFVDVLEGVTLLLVFGPLVLAGAGFLAWQWFKRRLITCPACGTPSFGAELCPACGTSLGNPTNRPSGVAADQPASSAVIDVEVRDVSSDH